MIEIPEEMYNILSYALVALENNDSSMSGRDTADSRRCHDWLMENVTGV